MFQTDRQAGGKETETSQMQLPSVLSRSGTRLGFPPMQDHPSFPGQLRGNDANKLLLVACYGVHLISVPSCFVQRLISPLLILSVELKNRVTSLLMAQIASYEAWLDLGGQLLGF